MKTNTGITLVATILVAMAGFIITYTTNLRLARRRDRLDRVNRQLSELYGPLYVLVRASRRVWTEFVARHPLEGRKWYPADATEEEARVWRLWISTVFQPLNRQMNGIIIQNGDLLIESHLPPCLEDLCAHCCGYEAVVANWGLSNSVPLDRVSNVSVIKFPQAALEAYLNSSFESLKEEQSELIARVQRK